MSIYQHLTEDDFNIVCDAFDILSKGAGLFYVLSNRNEFSELVISLAEHIDEWDSYLQTN